MKQKQITIIFAATILLFGMKATSAQAADWFVRPWSGNYNLQNGNDYDNAWNGLDAVKWGASGVQAGDTLWVCGRHGDLGSGQIYLHTNLIVGASGTGEDNRITIRGDCSSLDSSFQNGEMWRTSWRFPAGGGGWTTTGTNDVYTRAGLWGSWDQIYEDLTLFENRAADLSDMENWQPGTWHYDTTNHILYIKPLQGVDPNTHTYINPVGSKTIDITNHDYITVKNLKFVGSTSFSGSVYVDNSDYPILENLDISNGSLGIWVYSSNNGIIRNNKITRTSQGITLYTSANGSNNNWLIQNNEVSMIGRDPRFNCRTTGPCDMEGISIQDGSNNIFEYNRIQGDEGNAVVFYSGLANIYPSENNIVRYNRIDDVGVQNNDVNSMLSGGIVFAATNANLVADNTKNNLIYGNVISNIRVHDGGTTGSALISTWRKPANGFSILFYNNTVYNSDRCLTLGAVTEPNGVLFKNNICLNIDLEHLRIMGGQTGIDSDSNIFYPDFTTAFNIGNVINNFNGYKNYTGRDENSKIGNPLLTDPDNFNFVPAIGSPAIDAGANVGLTADFEGTPVPQGSAPDIGAFEYKAAGPIYANADINQDNSIDSTDLDILKTDFLRLTASLINPRSDINLDGQCTARDLGILMSEWK
jgi:parallel beta-helix repeat protein